ncbi:MAG: cell division protein SepF [Nanobdellota archaeon]
MVKNFFSRKKDDFDQEDQLESQDYVELNTGSTKDPEQKMLVRPFVIDDFADVKPILDVLRESYTIALINIKPLKEKDLLELKRAINKLKKTCEAIEGDIAGFGEDYIVITPHFAEIYRGTGGATSPDIDE